MPVPSYIKLSPQMDTATLVNALNTNFNQVQSQDRRKVITDENGKDRIIIGRQDDGKYAIRVSDRGKDASSTLPGDLVMSSDWQMWKIINSGVSKWLRESVARSGTLALNSTYIGYVNRILIPLPDLDKVLSYDGAFDWESQVQLFVRDVVTKKDYNESGIYYHDGTNWATINRRYYIFRGTKYLTIETIIRWMGGTVTITPQNIAPQGLYWQIANPTRSPLGGQGGGGAPTGKYVYHDVAYMNDDLETVAQLDSYTLQLINNAASWLFPGL